MSVTFETFLERTENYMQTIRDAGDLPWFEDPERILAIASKLGLPADTPTLELRRALFERGRQ